MIKLHPDVATLKNCAGVLVQSLRVLEFVARRSDSLTEAVPVRIRKTNRQRNSTKANPRILRVAAKLKEHSEHHENFWRNYRGLSDYCDTVRPPFKSDQGVWRKSYHDHLFSLSISWIGAVTSSLALRTAWIAANTNRSAISA